MPVDHALCWLTCLDAVLIHTRPIHYSSRQLTTLLCPPSCSYAVPLVFRVTVGRKHFSPGPFNLGRFGVPITCVACLWIAFAIVMFIMPQVRWLSCSFEGVVLFACAIAW